MHSFAEKESVARILLDKAKSCATKTQFMLDKTEYRDRTTMNAFLNILEFKPNKTKRKKRAHSQSFCEGSTRTQLGQRPNAKYGRSFSADNMVARDGARRRLHLDVISDLREISDEITNPESDVKI